MLLSKFSCHVLLEGRHLGRIKGEHVIPTQVVFPDNTPRIRSSIIQNDLGVFCARYKIPATIIFCVLDKREQMTHPLPREIPFYTKMLHYGIRLPLHYFIKHFLSFFNWLGPRWYQMDGPRFWGVMLLRGNWAEAQRSI